ncbi:MAG: hypothetical protein F6K42_26865 [Leptolyngbya sp. SIO1D8]|nr:hypothetical protein [Leptolyngbya sp. SIO1D8]
MTSNPSSSEDSNDKKRANNENFTQNISDSPGAYQQFARGNNILQCKELYIDYTHDFLETHPIVNSQDRIFHYVLILLSLFFYLVIWFFGGLFFTKVKFPVEHVFHLLMKCFKDPKKLRNTVSEDIQSLKNENFGIDRTKNIKDEYIRLNKIKEQLFLNKKLINLLYQEDSPGETIPEVIHRIEVLESYVDLELDPLKKQYDPLLYKTQKALEALLGEKNAAEKDLENIQASLKYLISRYDIYANLPSQESFLSLVSDLANDIEGNPYAIRADNLRTLKNVLHLLQWSSYLINDETQEYTDFYFQRESEELESLNLQTPSQIESDTEKTIETPLSFNFVQDDETLPLSLQDDDDIFRTTSSIDFLCSQLEFLLRETTNESAETIERLKLGIRNRWVSKISVYGFENYDRLANDIDLAAVEISLSINEEYQNEEIVVHGQKVDNLDEAIRQFKLVIEKHRNLVADWRVNYTDSVNENHELKAYVQEILNLSTANKISWTHVSWLLDINQIVRQIKLPGFSMNINFGPYDQRYNNASLSNNSSHHWIPIFR